jgi:hypothetical protein
MRTGKARTGLRAGLACHRRRNACGNCLPFGPEVGAVCGKAARTVLCGGREVTRVPTAKAADVRSWHIASFRGNAVFRLLSGRSGMNRIYEYAP